MTLPGSAGTESQHMSIVRLVVLVVLVQVVKERDLIGAQLVRRNDEVSLLYEKMKIVDMTMHKGERQYSERLEDIRVLKLEIRSQRCKIIVLEKRIEAVDDLRFGKRIQLTVSFSVATA